MKINNFKPTKSSFISIEKDLEILTNIFFSNDKLMKLLHYDCKEALSKPNLTPEQKVDMFGKNIKIKKFQISKHICQSNKQVVVIIT